MIPLQFFKMKNCGVTNSGFIRYFLRSMIFATFNFLRNIIRYIGERLFIVYLKTKINSL